MNQARGFKTDNTETSKYLAQRMTKTRGLKSHSNSKMSVASSGGLEYPEGGKQPSMNFDRHPPAPTPKMLKIKQLSFLNC